MMHVSRTVGFGIFITLLGGSLWGVSGTSMQYLTVQVGISPLLVTMMRVLFAGMIYLAYLVIFCRPLLVQMFRKAKTVIWLLIFAAALYSNQLFYAEAVKATNAGTATVLQMLECAFVLIFICGTARRLPKIREVAGLILALFGTLLIATQGNLGSLSLPLSGLIWGLLTAVASAAYILIPKQSHLFDQFGAVPVIGAGMVLSLLFAIPVYSFQGGTIDAAVQMLSSLSVFDWATFLFGLVLLGTIAGYVAYLYGTSIVGPVRGALLGAIEPVSATVMSALFLGTVFTGFDIAGMIIMCLMVVLLSKE